MKITLWGINYAPESVGIAPFNRDLAEFLVERGHQVTAVVAFSYYPQWQKEPADRGCWHRVEMAHGVEVHRCWCYVPRVVTTWRRVVHELTFGLASALRALLLPRADVYVVVSPPLVLGLFAWIVTRLKRSRFVFHVQDLQPDAAVSLGMLRRGAVVRTLYGLERLAYAKAAAVSGISGGMMNAFRRKGVPDEKCVLLPNWLHADFPSRTPADRALARTRFGISESTLLAVYSGNLGRKQSLEVLVHAASILSVSAEAMRIKLIIAGDGAARVDLARQIALHPHANVELLPLLSEGDYAQLLTAADIALITQAAGTGQFFLPSKLLSVLSAGLPVLAVADEASELARAVHAGGFGRVVPPGDAAGLAAVLSGLVRSPAEREEWARHAEWVRQFSREAVLPRFEQLLLSIAQGHGTSTMNERMNPKETPDGTVRINLTPT